MIVLISPWGDLRRTGPEEWVTTGDDPQFRFSRLPGGPRWLVVELEAGASASGLEPTLFLRGEDGFDEARSIPLGGGRRRLFAVDLFEGPASAGVRLDPCEESGISFSMRTWRLRTLSGLNDRLAARIAAGAPPAQVICGETARIDPAQGVRMKLGATRAADWLQRIWGLAAVEAGRNPLPEPEGVFLSVLTPVYNAAPEYLDALVESVKRQGAGVELVLSDDGSTSSATCAWLDRNTGKSSDLTILRSKENGGIACATNAALAVARGEWVTLVDHDDALADWAVDRIRRALASEPQTVFLYTDEAVADERLRPTGIFCKPAFDPVLLSGVNFVNHLSVYQRKRLSALGGLREGFHGSQDYDLVWRYCAGLSADKITHLPYPAYLWRQLPGSVSHSQRDSALQAARRTLAANLSDVERVDSAVIDDLHRPRLTPPSGRISVVIPNRDCPELIGRLLEDLEKRTEHSPDEIIIVDNGSRDRRTLEIYERAKALGVIVDIKEEPFNFSAMVNRGVGLATGEQILLLNNDIQVEDPTWLGEMRECLAYEDVGIVGAKLLYPNRTIQHAGVIVGLAGLAGHWHLGQREEYSGPMGRLAVRGAMTAVTGACLLTTRACWDEMGGFDETEFCVAYNDVDYCLRARAAGWSVVWTPFAQLLHHESYSRGPETTAANAERFAREQEALKRRHGTDNFLDPAHSPWWSQRQSATKVTVGDVLPGARHFLGIGRRDNG